MKEQHKRRFTGVWIPKALWEATDLTLTEKCLLAEINSLDDDLGCYASNGFFSDHFQIDIRSVANSLSKLRKLGWLKDLPLNGEERRLAVQIPPEPSSLLNDNGVSLINDRVNHLKVTDRSLINDNPAPPHSTRDNSEITVQSTDPFSGATKRAKKLPKASNPNHKVFIDLWMARYESKFKFKYTFQGGRDAKCVSELLAGDLDPAGLMNIAELAWNRDGYPFNSSRSIVGFKSLFNEIRAGVTSGPKGYPPRNGSGSGPRNDGSSEPMVNVRTIEFK